MRKLYLISGLVIGCVVIGFALGGGFSALVEARRGQQIKDTTDTFHTFNDLFNSILHPPQSFPGKKQT